MDQTLESTESATPQHVTASLPAYRWRLLSAFCGNADNYLGDYSIRILNNIAIFAMLAVSYNLINGVTGQFSLGPNAFLAIGAYTSALLTLSPEEKLQTFIIEPMIWPLFGD